MARRSRKNIGILGLGIIGSRVADNLRRKGYPVFVWNRTPRPVPNFVGSPVELAELCDIVQLFVSDDDAVLEMVQRMKSALGKQHIVVVNSTISPDTVRAAAEIVERRGGRLVDAPFTGSKGAAANGELVYYVGCAPETLEEVRPVLSASGKEIVEIGSVGQASAMKVATNIITAAVIEAAAEALALTSDAGIPPERFVAAMRSNGSNSKTLEMKLPKMISGDLEPQFSVKHMLKDMSIASRAARSVGQEFRVADAARHALQALERGGRADADYAALIRNFFPDEGSLTQHKVAGESSYDHPTLAGLDAAVEAPRVEEPPPIVPEPPVSPAEPNATNGSEARPAEPATVSTEATTPDIPSAAESRVESDEIASAPETSEPAQAAVSSGGGGLFRRFLRRDEES